MNKQEWYSKLLLKLKQIESGERSLADYITEVEQKLSRFKVYKCTDCQSETTLEDNGEITVGFCSKCSHPLWND